MLDTKSDGFLDYFDPRIGGSHRQNGWLCWSWSVLDLDKKFARNRDKPGAWLTRYKFYTSILVFTLQNVLDLSSDKFWLPAYYCYATGCKYFLLSKSLHIYFTRGSNSVQCLYSKKKLKLGSGTVVTCNLTCTQAADGREANFRFCLCFSCKDSLPGQCFGFACRTTDQPFKVDADHYLIAITRVT